MEFESSAELFRVGGEGWRGEEQDTIRPRRRRWCSCRDLKVVACVENDRGSHAGLREVVLVSGSFLFESGKIFNLRVYVRRRRDDLCATSSYRVREQGNG